MAFQAGGAFVDVKPVFGRGWDQGMQAGFRGSEAAARRAGERTGSGFASGFASKAGAVAKAATVAFGGVATAAVATGVKTAMGMQQAQIAFTTMLGSGEKAAAFLTDLKKFAASTPFEFPELQTAAQSLISVGIDAKKVIPIMTSLGNATAGMGTGQEGIKRATVALQQMNAAGRITAEDLNQLRDAGIPVYELLAKATGKSQQEVAKLAQTGKLGKTELDAMMKALESGKGLERFAGMMDAQSKTLGGMLSTLKDTFSTGMADAVLPLFPLMQKGVDAATKAVEANVPKIQKAFQWIADNGPSAFEKVSSAVRGLFDLVVKGDFTGNLQKAFGWSEDDPMVERILTLREQVTGLFDALKGSGSGDATARLGEMFSDLGKSLPAVGPTIDLIGKGLGFLADHAETVGKVLPYAIGALLTFKAAQAANSVAGRDSAVGIGVQLAGTISLTAANFALSRSLNSAAASQKGFSAASKSTAASVAGTTAAESTSLLTRIRTTVATVAKTVAEKAAAVASKAMAAGQWLLNAALSANPIGLVVVAIAALVAGMVIAYNKSETFRNIVQGAWNGIKAAAGAVVDWLKNTAWPIVKSVFDWIGKIATWLWGTIIKPSFTFMWNLWSTVFSWLKNTAWPIVKSVFDWIGKIATWLWGTIIKPYFTFMWNLWSTVFSWLKNTAWPIVKSVFDWIGKIATWLWGTIIKPSFTFMWNLWSTVFSWLKNTAWPIVKSVFDWIGKIATWLWGTIIKPYFTFMWNLWSTVFSWLKNTAWPIVRDVFGWIADKATWLWNKGIKPAFDLIKGGVGAIVTAFKNAKASVGKAWDGLLSGIRGPVLTALAWIDGHLIKPINSLLEKVGIAKIPSIMQNIPGNSGSRSLKGGTQKFATGGPVFGAGTATSDSIPAMLSNNEHVWTAREVAKAGGHRVMEWMRRAALAGDLRRILPTYAIGGRVSGLNAEFLRRLGLWNAAMGGRYSVSSGYRSIAEQTILWNRSDKSGRWVARPGSSKHNYGLAADLAPATLAAHRSAAGQHGLIFPMSWEPWHIEPVGIRSGQGVVGGILDAVAEKALAEINALIGRIPGRGVMGDAVRGGLRMFGRGLKAKVMALAFSDPANVSVPSGLSGSNRQIGQQMAARYGWTGAQWTALEKLWTGESNWNHLARNPSSGAYGIPQSLPASKMASVAGDWQTNPATQIKWGLDYIADRYGSPLAAYNAWLSRNPHWYSGGGRVEPVRPFVADSGVRLAPGINVLDNRLGKPEPLARVDKEMLVRLHPDDLALLRLAVEQGTEVGAARGVGSGAAYVTRVGG